MLTIQLDITDGAYRSARDVWVTMRPFKNIVTSTYVIFVRKMQAVYGQRSGLQVNIFLSLPLTARTLTAACLCSQVRGPRLKERYPLLLN